MTLLSQNFSALSSVKVIFGNTHSGRLDSFLLLRGSSSLLASSSSILVSASCTTGVGVVICTKIPWVSEVLEVELDEELLELDEELLEEELLELDELELEEELEARVANEIELFCILRANSFFFSTSSLSLLSSSTVSA